MQNKQVITNMLLSKEAMFAYIQDLKRQQAAEFGLTVEQYEQAVASGSVLTPKNKNNGTSTTS